MGSRRLISSDGVCTTGIMHSAGVRSLIGVRAVFGTGRCMELFPPSPYIVVNLNHPVY